MGFLHDYSETRPGGTGASRRISWGASKAGLDRWPPRADGL